MFDIFLQKCTMLLPYPALALVLSLFLTWLSIFFLPRFGFIDIPRGRHQHKKPVPRGGGIAIWLAFFTTTFLVTVSFRGNAPLLYDSARTFLLHFLPPAAIILIVGVLDDRLELRSWFKLLAQIAAGAVIWFEGAGINHIFAWQLPDLLSLAVTVFWSVIIINAFNLIDGLDGIAAGLAAISSFLLAVWSLLTGDSSAMTVILLIFCTSCLGFLRYNFSPAKIFMGDTGSMFLGLFFAYVSMRYSTKSVTTTALLVPLAAIGIPVFDVFLAIWRRFFRRYIQKDTESSIMQGDHDHLHHRILKETGATRKSAYIIYFLSLSVCLLAMICTFLVSSLPALVFVLLLLTFFVMIRYSGIELFDTLTSVAKGVQRPHRNIVLTVIHPVLDVLFVVMAFWISSCAFRNVLPIQGKTTWIIFHTAPFVLFLCISGIYRTFWLRVGIIQYYRMIRLLCLAGLCGYILNGLLCLKYYGMPQEEMWKFSSFYMVFLLLTITFIVGERFLIHYYESFGYRRLFIRNQGKVSELERILIYGGGMLCRIYVTRQFSGFNEHQKGVRIVGIIDDDKALRKLNVYGFDVLGGVHELEEIHKTTPFDTLVLASHHITGEKLRQAEEFCRSHGLKLKKFSCEETELV